MQRIADYEVRNIIQVANKQKKHREGNESVAFIFSTQVFLGLLNAFLTGRADGVKLFVEVNQNTRSRHNHPYYDVVAIECGGEVLRTVRPSLSLEAYNLIHQFGEERPRGLIEKSAVVQYQNFESELPSFELNFPENWFVPADAEISLWMTSAECENFGTVKEFHENFSNR